LKICQLSFVVNPWKPEELERAQKLIYSDIPIEVVTTAFLEVGGVARYIFDWRALLPADSEMTSKELTAFVKEHSFNRIDQALKSCDIVELVKSEESEAITGEFSSRLLHVYSTEEDPYYRLDWASKLIAKRVSEARTYQQWLDVVKQYNISEKFVAKGFLFELLSRRVVIESGRKFEIRRLYENKEKEKELESRPTLRRKLETKAAPKHTPVTKPI
jgi:hypothetical protein